MGISHPFPAQALLVTYLVVPTVTTTVFRTFVCEPFDAEVGGELRTDRLLVADVTVDCGSASYAAHRIFALLMVAVWPVGVPLWYFVLLRDARARIDPEVDGEKARMKADGGEARVGLALEIRDGDASIQHLSLLYGPYEGEFWYWEIVELLRRVAATSVVMVVSDGDVSRLFYCIILSILSLNLYDLFEPFISASDDLLAEALQLITLLNFIATLGFAVGAGSFLGALMLALQLVAVVASAALIWTDVRARRPRPPRPDPPRLIGAPRARGARVPRGGGEAADEGVRRRPHGPRGRAPEKTGDEARVRERGRRGRRRGLRRALRRRARRALGGRRRRQPELGLRGGPRRLQRGLRGRHRRALHAHAPLRAHLR